MDIGVQSDSSSDSSSSSSSSESSKSEIDSENESKVSKNKQLVSQLKPSNGYQSDGVISEYINDEENGGSYQTNKRRKMSEENCGDCACAVKDKNLNRELNVNRYYK